MDHLKEAKKFAKGANQTDRAELRSSEALNAIAHALIAIAEQLGKGIDVNDGRPEVYSVEIMSKP